MTKNTRRTLYEHVYLSRAEQRKRSLLEAETELAKEEAEALKMTDVSITRQLCVLQSELYGEVTAIFVRNSDRFFLNLS